MNIHVWGEGGVGIVGGSPPPGLDNTAAWGRGSNQGVEIKWDEMRGDK